MAGALAGGGGPGTKAGLDRAAGPSGALPTATAAVLGSMSFAAGAAAGPLAADPAAVSPGGSDGAAGSAASPRRPRTSLARMGIGDRRGRHAPAPPAEAITGSAGA
mmetsp:Transcript_41207/g.106618  ORF Transcript_41207/g.106618 Transcript_41207/m.106618 type:complete len:106 (+) Transcript_41207:1309-1626(+)